MPSTPEQQITRPKRKGLRKVKRNRYVHVPNELARDAKLSYRARGVLVALLSHEDGWDVRAEDLARDGREGRDAIRAALRELGNAGYYRLERRLNADRTWSMGTAVSDYPVTEWIADFKNHGSKGAPVVEREGGEYVPYVKAASEPPAELDLSPEPDVAPEQGGSPETGFQAPGNDPVPGDGFPVAGNPASGKASPLEGPSEDSQKALRASGAEASADAVTREQMDPSSASVRSVPRANATEQNNDLSASDRDGASAARKGIRFPDQCTKHQDAPNPRPARGEKGCRGCMFASRAFTAALQVRAERIAEQFEALENAPECPHGQPGGDLAHPEHPEVILCPRCRAGAPADDVIPEMTASDFAGLLTVVGGGDRGDG